MRTLNFRTLSRSKVVVSAILGILVGLLVVGTLTHGEVVNAQENPTAARVAKVILTTNLLGGPQIIIVAEPVNEFNFKPFSVSGGVEFSPTAKNGQSCTIALSSEKVGTYVIEVPADGGYEACTQPPARPHGTG